MKKIYAFFAAALMSASMFATAPTIQELAENYDLTNNVVLCIEFIEDAEVCNNVYFVGPVSWAEDFSAHPQFRPVPNHEGWYAAQAPYSENVEGKPVQAKSDGSFSWDFQSGDMDAWVYVDGVTANFEAGYEGEAKVKYPSAGAYIYQLKYWKLHKTPCQVAVKHKYTINLYAPECEESEFVPAAIGDFNGWAEGVQMNADVDEKGVFYTLTFEDEEGHGFKFRQAGISDWSNQIQMHVDSLDEWKDCGNITLPVATADTTLVIDYSDPAMYRWAQCGEEPCDTVTEYSVVVKLTAPAGAPAAGVEIIGDFDEWQGTMMTLDNGVYTATITTKECAEFKYREAGNWDNQIKKDGKDFQRKVRDAWNEAKTEIVDDLSGEEYAWSAAEEGIENIVLTEKAQKVVVDGVLYIVRDNKMFNVHGAQVR